MISAAPEAQRNHGRYRVLRALATASGYGGNGRDADIEACCERGVFPIDGFIGRQDCGAFLRDLQYAVWRPSLTYTPQADGSYLNQHTRFRVSETAAQVWFTPAMRERLGAIESRLAGLLRFDPVCLEEWQATRYAPGGYFDYHTDAGYWSDHPAGERIFTFLIHLRTPRRGGGTHFRAHDLNVAARACRLVVWDNLFPHGGCDHRTIHSAVPLRQGEKITLVTWLRQKPYRLAEPRL